jgi:hypothetical protein
MRVQGTRRGPAIRVAIVIATLTAAVAGRAQAQTTTPTGGQENGNAAPVRAHREFNIVPIAGGDSDVGIGFGEVSDWASLQPGHDPYRWRLESGAFITFKLRDGNKIILPYQDYYVVLTLPNLTASKRLRFDIRPSFTNETTLKYYGIGNASPLPAPTIPVEDTEYGRIHPTFSIEARYRVYEQFYVRAGSVYTYDWLTVRPTSLLARDQASGSPDVRALLGNFDAHGVELLMLGVEYDSRNNENVTTRGQFHAAQLRVSPKIAGWLPYSYEQLNLTARFYTTPIANRLTVVFRVVGDAFFGTPPFYELARFDDTPAIGGGKALRGVPAQRYYGKVKLFENLEARSQILPFTLKGKHMVLGVAAFFDAGRTWTELLTRHPDLDGTGLGLKYGIGGGLRLQEGETFVVRADIAWSPDAQPIGGYFAAGEIF